MKEMKLTTEQRERFFLEINQKSDKIMNYALGIYFAFGVFLAGFYGTFVIAFGVGGFSLVAYFGVRSLLPKSSLYQYVASAVLAIFTAQFIYQMHGLFEMHFFVFVGTTLLISYQNWKLQLPLTLLVVIHHAVFAYLQYSGIKEIYFSQLDYMDLQAFLFHGALAAVISAICGYWSYDLQVRTVKEAEKTLTLEKQIINMNNNITFAEEISKGNLNIEYDLLDNSDELGKSLMKMRSSLIDSNKREKEEKFITLGITKVGDIIRKNSDNLKGLSDDFISGLVKYLGINQAGLFLYEEDGNTESLNLTACYAFERKKYLKRSIAIGEGLIGQCYLEKDIIYMTDVPEEYITITSGLGGSNPGSVLLVPVMTNEQIVGVLELASFKPFSESQIEFIKRSAENIASSIVSSRITERVKRLLEESQQQAEEMKAQEEEMRQNMEELQATQEEMLRKTNEVESLLQTATEREKELNLKLEESRTLKKEGEAKSEEMLSYMNKYRNTLLGILDHLPHKIFLKDKDGKMVLVNTVVAKAHNLSVDELIGKSDFDFVDAETAQEWRNQELEIIRKGSETYVFNETLNGETTTLKSTKLAFFIPHLEQTGLLGIQTDITELQKLKTQMSQQ